MSTPTSISTVIETAHVVVVTGGQLCVMDDMPTVIEIRREEANFVLDIAHEDDNDDQDNRYSVTIPSSDSDLLAGFFREVADMLDRFK